VLHVFMVVADIILASTTRCRFASYGLSRLRSHRALD